MYKSIIKRIFDVIISFVGIVVLSIPMIIVGVVIKLDSSGPVLFKQMRLGKGKNAFSILKFRTMCDHAYEKGGIATSESDVRITKIGKILRRASIDELPQLFNILIGQMSIIGPRPILDWEYEEYSSEEYEDRFLLRPGLFCTVDTVARNADREQQFLMDAIYCRDCSFILDVKTLFGVIKPVLTGKGVYRDEKEEKENVLYVDKNTSK